MNNEEIRIIEEREMTLFKERDELVERLVLETNGDVKRAIEIQLKLNFLERYAISLNVALFKANEKLKELKAKLAEYEIIEDDLADLKKLKQENADLKAQILYLKTKA